MRNELIVFAAKYFFYLIGLITLVYLLFADNKTRIDILKISIISAPLALILARISSIFVYDTRPFVTDNVVPLIPHAADNGFPSDHTLAAMLIALVIFKFNRKIGMVLIILALLLGVARVLVKIHHPLDIAGSIVIDLFSVWIALMVSKKFSSNLIS